MGKAYLVPHKGLLDGSEVLQGREEHVPILWTADVFHEAAQLVAERGEHFVFVFYRFCRVLVYFTRDCATECA